VYCSRVNNGYRLIKSTRELRTAASSSGNQSNLIVRYFATMRLGQIAIVLSIAASLTVPALATTHTRRGLTSPKATGKHPVKSKLLGQRSIDDERATQIQAALIKAGYLTGAPSGHWDAGSIAAMTKVQADNGWQTKLVPDSRALIKLGLGPNAASASSLVPPTPAAASSRPTSLAQR
jgi:hypothetical protein